MRARTFIVGWKKSLQKHPWVWPLRIPCKSLSSLLERGIEASDLKSNEENTEKAKERVHAHMVRAAKQIQQSILTCAGAKAGEI